MNDSPDFVALAAAAGSAEVWLEYIYRISKVIKITHANMHVVRKCIFRMLVRTIRALTLTKNNVIIC